MKALPPGKRGKEGGFHIPPYEDVPGEEPVIEAQHLTKRFGSFTAVNDVSFRIRKGEIFGFLGSNGCGKSTTMKMLTGLLDPTSGYARVLGQPINAEDLAVRMKIGYMSQAFSLYEELTVRENLELHARLYNLPKERRKDIIEKSLSRFGLTGCADEKPSALPLGVKQRLQLAAACQHGPQILILDEPTSGVDPAARDMFWDYLITLSREERVTIFVTTHFMNEAARCDRISLMHRGKVLAVGGPEDAGGEDRVHPPDAFVGGMDAAPRTVENAVVVRVGALRRIDALHHRAGREVLAAVADVRRHEEPFALALDEVRADLEAARRAAERAPGVPSVALDARTAVEQRADAVRALVVAVRFDRAVDEFPQDRRFPPPEIVGDLLDGESG